MDHLISRFSARLHREHGAGVGGGGCEKGGVAEIGHERHLLVTWLSHLW